MKLSLAQLVALAAKHGFPDPELAAAIAMAESGDKRTLLADTNATNDTRNRTELPSGWMPEYSVGLWQINKIISKPNCPCQNPGCCQPSKYANWDLTDPDVNAQAAYEISQHGTNWTGPWYSTVVKYQSYKPFYHPAYGNEWVTPPIARPSNNALTAVLVAVALASAAGYVASERRRFA